MQKTIGWIGKRLPRQSPDDAKAGLTQPVPYLPKGRPVARRDSGKNRPCPQARARSGRRGTASAHGAYPESTRAGCGQAGREGWRLGRSVLILVKAATDAGEERPPQCAGDNRQQRQKRQGEGILLRPEHPGQAPREQKKARWEAAARHAGYTGKCVGSWCSSPFLFR